MLQDTSIKAWYELQKTLSDKQSIVLKEIRRQEGTCDEIAKRLGWGINRVSGRITELKKLELVKEATANGQPIYRNKAHIIKATDPLPQPFKAKAQTLF